MLEGKELVQKLGEYGEASLDVNENLDVELAVSAKLNIIDELEKLVKKTETPYDDKAVDALKWIRDLLKAASALPKE